MASEETLADIVVSLALTILSIILVSLLVFIMLKSMRAYMDVQQSVSVSTECDGAGLEREQPRWRMMFQPSPQPLMCNQTPNVMFNRAYDIFFNWYGKIDKSIIGLGVVIAIVCGILLMISMCQFPDAKTYLEYWTVQVNRIWWEYSPLEQIEGINNLQYGWFPYEFMNRPIRTWATWDWTWPCEKGIGALPTNVDWGIFSPPNILLGILFALLVNLPWCLVTFFILFVPQCVAQALWLLASCLKGLVLLDTHFSHINFVVVVVLLLLYSLFTRFFLRIDQDSLAQWRAQLDQTDCGPGSASLVHALQPILDASKTYQVALWRMGQTWLEFGQPMWQEYSSTVNVSEGATPSVVGFKAYLANRAVTIPVYNTSAILLDWLTRVQTSLQLSDADFGQTLHLPMTTFFNRLLVGGTDDSNPKFDDGKCGINASLMGYMVYDADFMQNVKGANANLYTAMAAVQDATPEVAFSRFFTRKAMWAALFVAIIAYLSLLRWNDVAVYYLLLTTLCVAGGGAFLYVCLHLVRTR